ncbi:TSUP family transporter [Pseudocolwellia agarivorans]|uniref:TSUP family transporter n=1 Tax=Pseudocolwellia agarivorans TaxID=1911682 RepID=UPI0009858837|nr:TSUP family transporter [Pseudocolwellia agarivorans]
MIDVVLDINTWITLCSIGFLAGVIDAIAGGGGMLTIPALLTSGLPPHLALGTNKLAASFGSFTASVTFYKNKLFNPSFWKYSLYTTAVGAIAGTLVVNYLSTSFLEKALPIIIVFTAIYTLFAKNVIKDSTDLPKKNKQLLSKQVIQGLTLGFYDGVAGPGTGAFWTVSSTILYKTNILISSGLARSTNFISNFFSLLTFIYLGHVNFVLGLSIGVFIMLGAMVGSHFAIKLGSKFIRPMFAIIVIGMAINLAYQAWQN